MERCNRTLFSMLATAATEQPFQWEDHLRRLCMAYNTSIHPISGYTPFYLMYGRQARMPIDVMYGSPWPEPTTVSDYASRLRTNLESAYEHVHERMGRMLARQKDIYDRKVHGKPFERGDFVWLHCMPSGTEGPFKEIAQTLEWTLSSGFETIRGDLSCPGHKGPSTATCGSLQSLEVVPTRHLGRYRDPNTSSKCCRAIGRRSQSWVKY